MLGEDKGYPNLGETQDQYHRRTGKGFFMNMPMLDAPITQNWQGDVFYWDNKMREAERMMKAAEAKAKKA